MTFFLIVGLIILIGVLFPDLSNSKTKKEHPASRLGEEDHAAWYLDESRAERQKAMAILKNELLKNETNISRNSSDLKNNPDETKFGLSSSTQQHLTTQTPAWMNKVLKEDFERPEDTIKKSIAAFVEIRNIEHLVHFTRLENIQNILKYGLVGRRTINVENIESVFNDKYRLDNVLDSVSVSISFPNYKMLYSLRIQNPNADWAIIKIDPSVLWEANCAFCFTNAAATPVASIPLEQRRNMESLKQMFAETQGQQSRRNLRIPENFPTDPQAEVLLLESIPPRYITSISVNNPSTLDNLRKIIDVNHPDRDNISIFCDKSLFSPRMDHEYWSKNA